MSKSESEVAQSCLTLFDPMDCSLPGSFVHGIFQARVLEWVVISFSRRSSLPRDWTQVSCIVGRRFTIWATREARVTWGTWLCRSSQAAIFFGFLLLSPVPSLIHPLIYSLIHHFIPCSWNQVPLKPHSPAEFMINYSKLYSVCCLAPVPVKIEEYRRKGGLKLSRTLWGLPGYKNPSMSPISCL